MGIFSEDSMLLIRNWDAVHDVFATEKQLRTELTGFLYSIKTDLSKNDWWQNGWIFTEQSPSEIYITKSDWQVKEGDTVLIGLEGFAPENIFGLESPPTLYVYVWGKRHNLVKKLAEIITETEGRKMGEVQARTTSGYVVKQGLIQCIPEEIDNYDDLVRNQAGHFFTHYANLLEKYDKNIKEYLVAE